MTSRAYVAPPWAACVIGGPQGAVVQAVGGLSAICARKDHRLVAFQSKGCR